MKHTLKHLIFTALLAATALQAEEGRFYFVGSVAPLGSMTANGQSELGVYLRWDVLDGALPVDLDELRLERIASDSSRTVLLDVTKGSVLSEGEIAALYQGPAQSRRLQETLLGLRERAAAANRSFTAAEFPGELRAALVDPGWTFFGTRTDFNVARALNRGYLDRPAPGVYDYELIGVNRTDALEARLGLVRIDSRVPSQPLGAASDSFQQIISTEFRCDLPESGKDHYSVSLSWGAPGTGNPADALASQVYLVGFDLYRTVDNLAPSVDAESARQDIAALARAADFDGRGQPVLPGLEKVNRTLISESGGTAAAPKWLETAADLARRGLEPGDRRAYYLVARDFTGNYGPTETAIVTVPNLVRPATPGPLRTFIDETNGPVSGGFGENLTLSWDAVNLANYVAAYGSTRRFCNQPEAISTGFLEFVGLTESCDDDPRRSVALTVEDYLVYRFPDFETAERFKDSDGDGIADSDEPTETRCNFRQFPSGKSRYLLNAGDLPGSVDADDPNVRLEPRTLPSGREVLWFQDRTPTGTTEQVYWYRVAARTPDGRLSFLSAPQRALVPDRELPAAPTVSMERTAQVPTGCEIVNAGASTVPRLTDRLDFSAFTVGCDTAQVVFDEKTAYLDSCAALDALCGDDALTLDYPAGPKVGPAGCEIPVDDSFCGNFELALEPTTGEGQVPVAVGQLVGAPLVLAAETLEPNTCVSMVVTVNDDLVRISDSCEAGEPRAVVEIPAGFVCGYAVARDENNNISTATHFPCVLIQQDLPPPAPPQIVAFEVTPTEAAFRWRLPPEPLAATLGELDWQAPDGSSNRRLLSLPAVVEDPERPLAESVAVTALTGPLDRWCLRLRSVAAAREDGSAELSEWSPRRCYVRRADGVAVPEYLPWPEVPGPVAGPALEATPLNTFVLGLLPVLAIDLVEISGLTQCVLAQERGLTGFPQAFDVDCTDVGRAQAEVALAPAVGFLAYRQRRSGDGSLGDWVQVAPLIEFAHWDPLSLPTSPFKRALTARLNDPYLELTPLEGSGSRWAFRFIDRYPYEFLLPGTTTAYRYQLIYFDEAHRPVTSRMTDWIEAGS